MTATAAIDLLVTRFPDLSRELNKTDDMFIAPPYFAYGLLAAETLRKHGDKAFLESVCEFITELSESGDALLEEVLVVSVLEKIAEDLPSRRKLRSVSERKLNKC